MPVTVRRISSHSLTGRSSFKGRWRVGCILIIQLVLVLIYLYFIYSSSLKSSTTLRHHREVRHSSLNLGSSSASPSSSDSKASGGQSTVPSQSQLGRAHDAHPPPPLAPEANAEAAARALAGVRIKAVASDTGSWNSVEAVVGLAAHGGAAVSVHFSGACARLVRLKRLALKRANVQLVIEEEEGEDDRDTSSAPQGALVQTLDEYVSNADDPHDILLVAASASAEGTAASQRAICLGAEVMRRAPRTPSVTLFVEDRYASALATIAKVESSCGPSADRMYAFLAADNTAKDVLIAHSTYTGRVDVVGAPMYDEGVRQRRAAARGAGASKVPAALATDGLLADEWRRRGVLRKMLRMDPTRDTLVLVAGQTTGTAQIVDAVCHGLKRFFGEDSGGAAKGRLGKLLLLEHPRSPPRDRAAAAAARARCTATHDVNLTNLGLAKEDSAALLAMRSEEWLPVADVVASGYSTTNFYAMLQNRTGVVYMAVPEIMHQFRNDKHLDMMPEVAAGAALSATDGDEFSDILELVLWSRWLFDPKTARLAPWWGAEAMAPGVDPIRRLREVAGKRDALLAVHDGSASVRVIGVMREALHAR
ncbi:O-fucosyltransferase family protein [Pseudoscourfieldia marina]